MSPPDTRTSEFTNAASIHSLAITRLNPAMSDFMSAGAHRPESDETAVAKRASRFGRARTFGSSLALALIAASAAGESTTRINVSSSGEQANGECRGVGISADGRFVVFASDATNLVAGDTNGVTDVFIRDRAIGTTQRVSVASDGSQANAASTSNPAISGNGRFVAFTTAATNLGNGGLFVHDLQTGTTTAAAVGTDASNLNPSASISEDGRFIAFVKRRSTGPNAWFDEVHTVDWTTGNDRFLALETNASAGPPSLSENARRVAFSRTSHSTEECIVWDLSSNSTTNVYVTVDGFLPNGSLDRPLLSGAGRYVAFTSTSSNLVARDFNAHADVFVRDLVTQTTSLVSLTHTGDFARSNCNLIAISSDGRWVAFTSRYGSLVRGDANHAVDVFLRDLSTGALSRVSLGDSGAEAWNACVIGVGALSRDARAIVF
ncbi:MAG: PD40 domain-containing protein [Planctomycetes bacterium]|nr:PD40 domain-containing protein [Planctomycetota bacterium]